MDIDFGSKKLRAELSDEAACRRAYGADQAKKIMNRLNELKAAESLADFWPPLSLSERCHELGGGRAGVFSMDLKHPYRLLFVPAADPMAGTSDQQERWKAIKGIVIISVEDTHG